MNFDTFFRILRLRKVKTTAYSMVLEGASFLQELTAKAQSQGKFLDGNDTEMLFSFVFFFLMV